MIHHLTSADYKTMPWANGKGTTVEMFRVDVGGVLKWRLSRAAVVEDGDFSLFAGINRNLTVISGPGFDLVSADATLPARPLQPVAFSGDLPILAAGVTGPCDDFNVMTAADLAKPQVQVVLAPADFPAGGTLAIFALAPGVAGNQTMALHDLIITDTATAVSGPAIVVRLW